MLFNLKTQDTSPIQTDLKEVAIAGANLASSSSFPTKIHDEVFIPKKMSNLSRLFLTKSNKGIISLHQLAPVIRIGHRIINNRPQIAQSLYFVAISCNKNEFDSTQADVHVFKDSTLSMLERGFDPESPFNGFSYNGSPSNGLIPRSAEAWTKPLDGMTIGEYCNKLTLRTFYEIKALQEQLNDSENDVEEEVVTASIAEKWHAYQAFTDSVMKKGILVASDFVYVDASSLRPIITCFQNTTSRTQKYLNAEYMYGNAEAAASYAPDTSSVVGYGIITATQAEPDSGYQYGQFNVTSKRGEVTTVAENLKATTIESCTREVAVFDESGRSAVMQLTVNDIARGENPIKRSSNLAQLAVGASVMVTGKLQIRSKGIQGSYAVNFRITDPSWTTVNNTSTSAVNMDVTSDDIDLSLDVNMDSLHTYNTEEESQDSSDELQVMADTSEVSDMNSDLAAAKSDKEIDEEAFKSF